MFSSWTGTTRKRPTTEDCCCGERLGLTDPEIAREVGIAAKDSDFEQTFKRLGITSHNGAGVTLGVEELLQVWACPQFRSLRQPCPETSILKALGFTDEDIEDNNVEAEFVTGLS